MKDVKDDDLEKRWLSVCIYSEMIFGSQELYDLIPEGLLEQDRCNFDSDNIEESRLAYIKGRRDEAYLSLAS